MNFLRGSEDWILLKQYKKEQNLSYFLINKTMLRYDKIDTLVCLLSNSSSNLSYFLPKLTVAKQIIVLCLQISLNFQTMLTYLTIWTHSDRSSVKHLLFENTIYSCIPIIVLLVIKTSQFMIYSPAALIAWHHNFLPLWPDI